MSKIKATVKPKYVRLMESMVNGKTFTVPQILATYKVRSARSMLYNIRKLGVAVSCYKDAKGNTRYAIK